MKILVTGANGYLGRGVVASIINRGHHVIATDFDIESIDERAERIKCNIFEIGDPYKYFGEPDVLLHLAWRDGFMHYSDAHIDDLPKHYKFISKMSCDGVKQIAVMGSMHEVGFFEGSICESAPCKPLTPYGVAKNALRNLVEEVCSSKKIVFQWLRGYYIVSDTPFGNSIFSKLVLAANEGKKEFPFTMGENQYDFIDYDVFCEQVASVVEQTEINGIINICSGEPEKLASRVERFIKENGLDIKLQYGVFPDRPYDSKAVWGNDEKIKKIMGIK